MTQLICKVKNRHFDNYPGFEEGTDGFMLETGSAHDGSVSGGRELTAGCAAEIYAAE